MAVPRPLPLQRRPKQTLNHLWAPKLNRVVLLPGFDQLALWTLLEANPKVSAYCERPSFEDEESPDITADFWQRRGTSSKLIKLQDEPDPEDKPSTKCTAQNSVSLIPKSILEEHRIWISNWLTLLPYLSWSEPTPNRGLRGQIVHHTQHKKSFAYLEHFFLAEGTTRIRIALIEGLHQGWLACPALSKEVWSPELEVVVSMESTDHAPL